MSATPGNCPEDSLLSQVMTSAEVAALLRVNPSTIRRWRLTADGPPVTWLTASTPRYLRCDVEAWLRRQGSAA